MAKLRKTIAPKHFIHIEGNEVLHYNTQDVLYANAELRSQDVVATASAVLNFTLPVGEIILHDATDATYAGFGGSTGVNFEQQTNLHLITLFDNDGGGFVPLGSVSSVAITQGNFNTGAIVSFTFPTPLTAGQSLTLEYYSGVDHDFVSVDATDATGSSLHFLNDGDIIFNQHGTTECVIGVDTAPNNSQEY